MRWLRLSATRFEVALSDRTWLPKVEPVDRLRLRLRVLAYDGGRPGPRVLVTATVETDTAAATRLVLRWPAIDLQAQRVWVEATSLAGSGLWPFDLAVDAPSARLDTLGATVQTQALPHSLSVAWLSAAGRDDPRRAITVRIDGQVLAADLPAGPFEIEVPVAMLPRLDGAPVGIETALRAILTLRSARLEIAL